MPAQQIVGDDAAKQLGEHRAEQHRSVGEGRFLEIGWGWRWWRCGAGSIREHQTALLQLGSNFDQEIAECKAAAQRFYGNLGQHPRPRDGERSNAIASTAAIKIKADDGSGTWPITATAGVELISIKPGRLPRFPIWFISLVPAPFPTLEIDGAASSPPTMPTGNPGPPMNGTGAPLSSSGPSPGPPYG